MTTATASTPLSSAGSTGASARLAPWLQRAVSGLASWVRRRAQDDLSATRQRDIAHVRRLAQQVRRSNPGYASDLEAAAAAFEAQDLAH